MKKAQMKIQEMAFVLLAVVFLFSLLLLFFARFEFGAFQQAATETRETRTVTMLRVIANMPELACKQEALCIDEDKLKSFESSSTRSRYSKLWDSAYISKIVVEEAYPKTSKRYTIYDSQPLTGESTATYSTFVSLCSESFNRQNCKIAKIKATAIVP